MKRSYGWSPDKPDQRDYKFSLITRAITRVVALPAKVDLRSGMPPVVDQGNLGSCTANALCGAFDYLQNLYLALPDTSAQEYSDHFQPSSRLFVYYNERVIEGTVSEDAGAEIRDGIKALSASGSCPEEKWPYVTSRFDIKPPKTVYTLAKKHRIKSYYRVEKLQDLKLALSLYFPVSFGFMVYQSFESAKVEKTGIVPMPKKSERALGGHAVLAVGYDDSKKVVIVRNSWGDKWGQGGYFTLPYAYIENKDLSDDYWVIKV
jgi:C1A family cysteine protease